MLALAKAHSNAIRIDVRKGLRICSQERQVCTLAYELKRNDGAGVAVKYRTTPGCKGF